MKHLLPLGYLDVTEAVLQLRQSPYLWNLYRERTQRPDSPHVDVDDIWVRYRDRTEFELGQRDWSEFNQEHDSVWYPAADKLPAVKNLSYQLMTAVRGERLGGVLVTRIPPGKAVKPHADAGWHAEYYDKFAVQLESHPDQAFYFEDGGYAAAPGEVYWFRNQALHWVRNDSPVDRVTLIVCIRQDRR